MLYIALGIITVLGLIALVLILIIFSLRKHSCAPFRYGGFTKENGYDNANRNDLHLDE